MNEIANRYAKALRLADFIGARRVADQAKTYDEKEREEIAAQAGENPPSEATWSLVLAILSERETPSDPFAGL
jgi:hypothetical protein